MSTNFAKEFKLYENLFKDTSSTKRTRTMRLTESSFGSCAVCGQSASAGWDQADAEYTPFGIVHSGKCLNTLLSDIDKKRATEFYSIARGELSPSAFTLAEIDEMRKAWEKCCNARLITTSTVAANPEYHARLFEDEVAKVFSASGRKQAALQKQIALLQQQLHDEKVAEKKASYGSSLPTKVYIWDIYLKKSQKGTWTSAELYDDEYDGYVYETADEAIAGGWAHLNELENENELDRDPDDYTIDAVAVPVNLVSIDTLSDSNLEHLI